MPTVNVGVLLPLFGSYTTPGATNKYVTDMVVDIINNEYSGIKNLGGAKIELIYGAPKRKRT